MADEEGSVPYSIEASGPDMTEQRSSRESFGIGHYQWQFPRETVLPEGTGATVQLPSTPGRLSSEIRERRETIRPTPLLSKTGSNPTKNHCGVHIGRFRVVSGNRLVGYGAEFLEYAHNLRQNYTVREPML
jgi:hypothetical protein